MGYQWPFALRLLRAMQLECSPSVVSFIDSIDQTNTKCHFAYRYFRPSVRLMSFWLASLSIPTPTTRHLASRYIRFHNLDVQFDIQLSKSHDHIIRIELNHFKMDQGDVNFTSIDSNSNHRVVKSAFDNVDFASSLWNLLATMQIPRQASGFCFQPCRCRDRPLDSACDYAECTDSLWNPLVTMRNS